MVATKRKDSKGRVLKDGERERKNGTYEYRYTDIKGQRKSTYARSLKELRDKEIEIEKSILNGLVCDQNVTVADLYEQLLKIKSHCKPYTKREYNLIYSTLNKRYDIGCKKVCNFKKMQAKMLIVQLVNDGYKSSTVRSYYRFIKSIFALAVDNDIILKNPFDFDVRELVPTQYKADKFLTIPQQRNLLNFLMDENDDQLYNIVVVLLNTGLRAGEFCGLTSSDIDFDKRTISVNHQLIRNNSKMCIATTKTETSNRIIPMTDAVYRCLKTEIEKAKQDNVSDSIPGIVFRNRSNNPMSTELLSYHIKRLHDRYNQSNPDQPIEILSPHVFRHTFCTNLIQNGVAPSAVQYIMGHSSLTTTMDIYTHFDKNTILSSNPIVEIF